MKPAPAPVRTPIADYLFREPLEEIDPETSGLSVAEEDRQSDQIILIASESLAPRAVREAMATVFANVYAEGYPSNRLARREAGRLADVDRYLAYHRRYGDRRFYKGTEYANFVEVLAQRRAAEVFATKDFPAQRLFVNVQPLSGAAANNAVYEAFLQPGDAVVGLHLAHGGHLTHGSPANRSGKRYRVTPYHVDPETGLLDYDEIDRVVAEAKPKLLIGGGSAYPYDIDWARLRAAADSVGAILLADVSHPAGLIAARLLTNPVGIADVVSMTTHKTLCGPRGAILISTDAAHARALDAAVFPGEQGGPHLHQIAAKAVAFAMANTEKFRSLMKQVVANARTLIRALTREGIPVAHGLALPERLNAANENDPASKKKELNYTHLFTIDLKGLETKTGVPLSGDVAANILDLCGITLNKNTLPGDANAARPSGLRIGTVFVTQRGLTESHMQTLAGLIARTLKSCETYEIDGGAGPVGRARIAPEVLQSIREGVRALAREGRWDAGQGMVTRIVTARTESPLTPLHRESKAALEERDGHLIPATFGDPKAEREAVDKGAALFDWTDRPILSVRGERARAFLGSVLASRCHLEPGDAAAAVLLSPAGETTDEPVLLRLPEGADGSDDFWVFDAQPGTLGWLQALSDGFVRFDPSDLYAKIDGPVAIEDLRHARRADRRQVVLGLAGPKVAPLLKAVCAPFGALKAGKWAQGAVDGAAALCVRPGDAPWYLLLTSAQEASRVWTRLRKEGATPAGLRAREAAKRDEAKPDLTKPYFIGVRHAGSRDTGKEAFVWRDYEGAAKRSCLWEQHQEKDAKGNKGRMVPFAGWEMPVLYSSIMDEHAAVRQRAGIFDITHMGTIEVAGPYAQRFIDLVTTNYVARLRDGQTQYSYVLGPDGAILDDILVYRRAAERFLLVVNASNADKLWAWFTGVAERRYLLDPKRPGVEIEGSVTLRNLKDPSSGRDQLVDVAVQGPKSLAILQRASDSKATKAALRDLKKSDFIETTLCGGIPVLVSRTGYTGENTGFELYLHPDQAPKLWGALLAAGEKYGLQRCGLGSRDSTRTEVGFPLYGHELAGKAGILPGEAGYGAFVKLHKPWFVGRDALIARMAASKNEVVRFRLNSDKARAVRAGYPVSNLKGQTIGEVTSCTLVGKAQIGMALIDRRFAKTGAILAVIPVAPEEEGTKGKKGREEGPAKAEGWVIPEFATVLERFVQGRVETEEEE
ncbi:MAG: glycine cleavage system aminomethyltransferase GcvT [Candidatus Brocadiae bacterium]|nr:glycine cleavage system aminomethyltransferase GcvT [Candidatus Brocadiia bacterium]